MTVTEPPPRDGQALPNAVFWVDSWPALEKVLGRVAGKRLPAGCDVRDATQHVAEALASRPGEFASHDAIARYAITVARNYVTRMYRIRDRDAQLVSMLAADSSEDVERSVINRLRLECLESLVAELNDKDRFAFGDPKGEQERLQPAVRTRRSRLRSRLRDEVAKKIGGAIIFPRLRWFIAPVAAGSVIAPSVLPLVELPSPPESRPSATQTHDEVDPAETVAIHIALPLASGPIGRAETPEPSETADPMPRPSPRSGYTRLAGARGPGGAGAEAGTRQPPPEAGPQPLLCLSGTEPLPPPCVARPLKDEQLQRQPPPSTERLASD